MSDPAPQSRLHFGRKNSALLAAALVTVAAGYWLLSRGSTTAAPLLLVLGYCVLFPVGLGR
ncbi:MAG TPA: hypothetical protein VLV16_12730 [Gemmatimonadales bacterium]|nr:hypothetical protein [Gemmatimonadales bacterium]